MGYLIVGIDPGKTVGVVCLDLKGSVVSSAHYSDESLESIIGRISRVGTPIIVAGDRAKPSAFVRRINASFRARIFSPKKELSTISKREIGRAVSIPNVHERDAYSAAIAAYHTYYNKFRHIERIKKADASRDVDRIKREVVLKRSVYEALTSKKANRE